MKATRLTKQLNIQSPIIQAGMPWVSNAELAATVCNSGGLGMITPNAGLQKDGDEIENYQTQLRKMKALTSRTYGVCLFMDHPLLDILVSITTEQAVPIVVTAGNGASDHTGHLKDAGITVFHVIGSVHQARSAEARGADGVIATGLEAAGPGSTDRLSLLTLVPQVVDAIEIPVIAAGGISDGRGLAAAIGLGASAAYIGTSIRSHPRVCRSPQLQGRHHQRRRHQHRHRQRQLLPHPAPQESCLRTSPQLK